MEDLGLGQFVRITSHSEIGSKYLLPAELACWPLIWRFYIRVAKLFFIMNENECKVLL